MARAEMQGCREGKMEREKRDINLEKEEFT